MFLAVNDSPDRNDRLVGITSDIGKVSMTGNKELPANGMLVIGAPGRGHRAQRASRRPMPATPRWR